MNKLILTLLALPAFVLADSVTLDSGETIEGSLLDTQANFILLRLPETEGEAMRRIDPQSIESLNFFASDAPLEQQAFKRAKFIGFLSKEDAQYLTRYLSNLIADKQALAALTYAKLWHPKNQYSELDPIYRKILIASSLAAKLPDEALAHAQQWLSQSSPPIQHPLPWRVQAQRYLDEGEYESALWTSLTPIAHAKHRPHDSLADLRAIASVAYRKLGYNEHAQAYQSANPKPSPALHFVPLNPPL